MRILDLALKDLYQIIRDWKAAAFLVIMPIAFTLLMGWAFSGVGGESDPRFPVGVLNLDEGNALAEELVTLVATSDVIRVAKDTGTTEAELAEAVADETLLAAAIIPAGYGDALRAGEAPNVRVIVDGGTSAGITTQGEISQLARRLFDAVQTAKLSVEMASAATDVENPDIIFEQALAQTLAAWNDPPFTLAESSSEQASTEEETKTSDNPYTHSSAGIMIQFAIAGLIGASEVVVIERRSRTLQRMLTTSISRAGIVTGHFLAMYTMVLAQLVVLVLFGQLALGVPYFRAPLATLVMVLATAFFTAALGMLFGALAKTEEQTVIYSMIAMMVLSGMGGAWMPLETTSATFQTIGRLLPTAWAIDGLKNITMRGLGLASVVQPALILLGFGFVCLAAAVWFFRVE